MQSVQVHQAEPGTPPLPQAAADAVQKERRDFPLVIATMPATDRQRAIAVGIVIVLIVAAAVMAPFASTQVGRIDASIPVLQTVVSVVDLITAILLFAQFSIQPQRALLALASGYIFSGSFAFLQTLAFPGGYAPAGLIGDTLNTPAWMYVLWHTTFPAAILVYALSKDATGAARPQGRTTATAIVITVTFVLAVIAGLTWSVTTKAEYLPRFYATDIRLQTQFGNQINLALWLWGCTVLAVLFTRRRTILDLWLIVTLLAYMPSFLVAIIGSSVRFTVGWYTARCFILIASCMVLSVLLIETTLLYSRLASAIILQRRERANRLLSVDAATAAIAHEINQPLGAMSLNCDAALECLKATPLDLEELRSCLMDVKNENSRANEIVRAVRALFKTAVRQRRDGCDQSSCKAIDAIAIGPTTIKAIRLITTYNQNSTVSLLIQDSGPGLIPKNETQLFDPFFTTKPSGMGLGLSISRRIIEDHGGNLRLTETSSKGSTFEITLPV
jgi:signal transduction histidine kinase